MDEANQRGCHGLRSPRGKLGMSAMAVGIVISVVVSIVRPRIFPPEQSLSFVGAIVFLILLLVHLLALFSIIFGSIVVLSTIVSGWLGRENKS